ncbi:hypothetical protein RHS03_08629, partial [Rhizoctonia solani]
MTSKPGTAPDEYRLLASEYRPGLQGIYQMCDLTVQVRSNKIYITASPKNALGPLVDEHLVHSEDAEFDISPCLSFDGTTALTWNPNGQRSIDKFSAAEGLLDFERWDIKVKFTIKNQEYDGTAKFDNPLDIVQYYDAVSRQFRLRLGLKAETSKRSIILCFDGTSNHFSNQNTNVIKLVELLKKDDPSEQMARRYPNGLTKRVLAGDQISIFGFSRGAYTARALAGMLHSVGEFETCCTTADYQDYHFGKFKVGLLPRHNMEQVAFAYQVYSGKMSQKASAQSHPTSIAPRGFKSLIWSPFVDMCTSAIPWIKTKSKGNGESKKSARFPLKYVIGALDISIREEGVEQDGKTTNRDSVGSVGVMKRTQLPWIEYNPSVENFRQALALDENRGNFIPSVWDHNKTERWQTAVEVWFKGGHTDVGGGAPLSDKSRQISWFETLYLQALRYTSLIFKVSDSRRSTVNGESILETSERSENPAPSFSEAGEDQQPPSLPSDKFDRIPDMSNISLRWMVNECIGLPKVRVLFDPHAVYCYRRLRILERCLHGATPEEKGKERDVLDTFDGQKYPYRALMKSLWWWLLEILMVPKLSQLSSNRSKPGTVYWYAHFATTYPSVYSRELVLWDIANISARSPNLGAGRSINNRGDSDNIRLHYSAYSEMTRGYRPAAKWYLKPGWGDVDGAYKFEPDHQRHLGELKTAQESSPKSVLEWIKDFLGCAALHGVPAGFVAMLWITARYLQAQHNLLESLSQWAKTALGMISQFFSAKSEPADFGIMGLSKI